MRIDSKKIEQVEQRIGYVFRDKELLQQALTHSSYANEQKINKRSNSVDGKYRF